MPAQVRIDRCSEFQIRGEGSPQGQLEKKGVRRHQPVICRAYFDERSTRRDGQQRLGLKIRFRFQGGGGGVVSSGGMDVQAHEGALACHQGDAVIQDPAWIG